MTYIYIYIYIYIEKLEINYYFIILSAQYKVELY